ncbi:hypothetical protein [Salinibius halmophilus]|uniref:hypothetical protein n=1 Tax=Salinibius halmophilus TaxID=1853216 RepID=UPI000E668C3C|nr:hypothetical protein [Salinibius halmophilus]
MKKLTLISLAALALAGCNVETNNGSTPTATPAVTATPTVSPTPTTGSVASLSFIDSNLQHCVEATGVEMIRDLTSLTCINQGISDASDIGELFSLQTLNLRHNPLTRINVENMALTTLDVSNIAGEGQLTSISLANMEQLTWLDVSGNKLRSLSAPQSADLSEVYFNNNQIATVSFQANGQLRVLHGEGNGLESIIVANGPLTNVDLSNNKLNDIDFPQPYSLRYADLSNNKFIDFPDWSINAERDYTRDLETLNLSDNSIDSIALPKVVETLILDGNNFTAWAPSEANSTLTTLSMDNNKLESITLPDGVEDVSLANNSLSSLLVPTSVVSLDISQNSFTALDLVNNTNMRALNVADNGFDRFDFPTMPAGLTSLNIARNNFIAANTNRFANLTDLTVDGNALTALNVDFNTELVSLSAEATTLSDLVLTENEKLRTINLTNNLFASVNPLNNAEGLTLNTSQRYTTVELSQNPLPEKEITELNNLNIDTLVVDANSDL